MYAPEAEWEWKLVPVKFRLSKGAETSVTLLLLGLINYTAACCSHLSSPRGVPAVSEGLLLLNRSKTQMQENMKESARRICTDLGKKL